MVRSRQRNEFTDAIEYRGAWIDGRVIHGRISATDHLKAGQASPKDLLSHLIINIVAADMVGLSRNRNNNDCGGFHLRSCK